MLNPVGSCKDDLEKLESETKAGAARDQRKTPIVYFTHHRWPKERFLHPFPIAVPDSDFTAESSRRWYPFVDFRAQSFEACISGPVDGEAPNMFLSRREFPDEMLGVLFPDSSSFGDLLQGTPCQLLAIAKWHEAEESDSDREEGDYQIAALWVNWDDGVAYR